MIVISSIISWWFFLGTFNLIRNSWKDIKTNYIDDKKNLIMLGMTFAFIPLLQLKFWYIIGCIVAVTIMNKVLMKHAKFFAEGDTSALTWIFLGLTMLSYELAAVYMISWFGLHLVYHLVRNYLFKMKSDEHLFYYPILTGAYIITYFFWIFR